MIVYLETYKIILIIFIFIYFYVNFHKDIDSTEPHVLSTFDTTALYVFIFSLCLSFNILCIFKTAELLYLSYYIVILLILPLLSILPILSTLSKLSIPLNLPILHPKDT